MTYITYNDEANALYVKCTNEKPDRLMTRTIYDKECMINLDFDSNDMLYGIEIILP